MNLRYGNEPELIGTFDLDFVEYCHWMYLPVAMAEDFCGEPNGRTCTETDLRLPPNLGFARQIVGQALEHETRRGNRWRYVYLTARRGWATPGNPLNRPGWHTDAFGNDDVNYVWTDRFPTDFLIGDPEPVVGTITDDHVVSMQQFERAADVANGGYPGLMIVQYPDSTLLRLDSSMIHAAPSIPAPGGERSFLKVSFSNDRYDLIGNSHNYELDYVWAMHPRGAVRNDPATAASDSASRKR